MPSSSTLTPPESLWIMGGVVFGRVWGMADAEQLEILRRGVEVWNEWRRKNSGIRVDLNKTNLINAYLFLVNLSDADLSDAHLSSAFLRSANLSNANLRSANLRSANLSNAHLSDADLSDAHLSDADLRRADLRGVKINEQTRLDPKWRLIWEILNQPIANQDLSGTDLSDANLRRADLSGVDLSRANLSGVDLSHANLSRANFSGADLSDANLWRTHLSGADLSDADLRRTDLSDTDLSGADLSDADLRRANLSRADFSEADLSDADLSDADLSDADLRGVKINEQTQLDPKWRLIWEILNQPIANQDLSNTDLSNTDLSNTDLSNTDLSNTDLSNTDLSNTDLRRANLRGVKINEQTQLDPKWRLIWEILNQPIANQDLSNTDLSDANLRRADLSGADLSRADLSRADLTQTQATYTNFESAILTEACIQDWQINSETNLNGVICEYVYLKEQTQNNKFIYTDRRPSDPSKTFAPGDFARLVQKSLDTVDLIFREGIDWQAFSASFQELKTEQVKALQPEQIKIEPDDRAFSVRAIESLDDGSFVVRINTPKDANKAEIERSFQEKSEGELKRLEGGYRERLQAKDSQIEQYKRENT
ncbi:MAG: pentapeptide repeat-containing protein, partial [Cyanobacteria bacterium SBLK]|nr:pentapeptide repeat-containing protein [Cyanobacteria bacterium SBLK]